MESQQCHICFDIINNQLYDNHIINCLKEQQNLINKFTNNTLTPLQDKALQFAFKKSKVYSKNTKLNALYRFKIKGLNEKDYVKTIDFLQNNVQIIIHVNLENNLQHYINDDYYRNLFEVNKSGGSNDKIIRTSWENKLFNNIYENSEPFEKVKYGAINLTNSPLGVDQCYSYGNSFFVLKNKLKDRCTFVLGDSSKMEWHLGTFKYCEILLALMPDQLLDKLIKIVNYEEKYLYYGYYEYIEIQIHGPLSLNQDIEMLVVNSKYKNNHNITNMLEQFSAKHNIPYYYTNVLDEL